MEFWFSELHSPHVKFDIRVEKKLFSGKSDYQRIDVFESPEFGKFLTLNGSVIFSEQDCFIYNEMVVVENKQYSFERMLHSQIFYLTKNFNKEVFEYRSRLNEYLKWIES